VKYEWCATWIIPRGAFSIHVSNWALSGASTETRIRECAALYLSATAPPSSNERVGQGKTEDAPLEMPPGGMSIKLLRQ